MINNNMSGQNLHYDEAVEATRNNILTLIQRVKEAEKALIINDLFGKIKMVVWSSKEDSKIIEKDIRNVLESVAGNYWSGDVWMVSDSTKADKIIYDNAWDEGIEITGSSGKLRENNRHRSKGGWFQPVAEPSWKVGSNDNTPPIVVFHSFKGGVGRSTALAAFAIQRARKGERIAAIDIDLDAPGIGTLFSDELGITSKWGVLDYLIEQRLGEVDLQDYYYTCGRETLTGPGEIKVFPAGRINKDYLEKLARVDLEPSLSGEPDSALVNLLKQVRGELKPDWILLDSRDGLSDAAGLLFRGLAHLHVLFGTTSEQSWQGLSLIIERLGEERVLAGKPQLECLIVQAMIPSVNDDLIKIAKSDFLERSRIEFEKHYYDEDPVDPDVDDLWYIRDMEDENSPHNPAHILYEPRLAHFTKIDDIADLIAEDKKDYQELANMIVSRFPDLSEEN